MGERVQRAQAAAARAMDSEESREQARRREE